MKSMKSWMLIYCIIILSSCQMKDVYQEPDYEYTTIGTWSNNEHVLIIIEELDTCTYELLHSEDCTILVLDGEQYTKDK